MENELKTNAVKLSPNEQYQIRKSIIRLSKKGKTNGEIAEILDVSERHVRSVKKQYSEGGLAALKVKHLLSEQNLKNSRSICFQLFPKEAS